VINSRRTRWEGYATRMGAMRNYPKYSYVLENLKGIDGRLILIELNNVLVSLYDAGSLLIVKDQ
jgi:hypothetical protein